MKAARFAIALLAPLGLVAAEEPKKADAPKAPAVVVTVDTDEAPDLDAWAQEARKDVEAWYPKIAELLAVDGFTPPKEVRLVFKPDEKGIAGTSDNVITISADYVRRHRDDRGMVIHELAHVVQSYPENRAGWLVEGIADYVRYVRYEPRKEWPRLGARASYRDGYGTTARFLAWIEAKYDKKIVPTLNAALRRGDYKAALFEDATGKPLDDLWDEFAAEARRPRDEATTKPKVDR
jgi:hypothetical protein